jgi:MoaA/NifB/PqqE/SkfB family radical SAM enzyme
MYFNMRGQVSACWLTLTGAPTYPERSLKEIWSSDWFKELRRGILERNLAPSCHVCDRNIRNGLYKNALAQIYDRDGKLTEFPQTMEFELSNLCNLECVMCKGYLSSTIRRERDRLPSWKTPYDDAFVEQLEEFIPHLKDVRFNGGEPLMQKICWDVWERIGSINPETLISVTTNGTTLNDKLKGIFEKGQFHFHLSIDSLTKATYESIRVGSSFDRVMENLGWLGAYGNRVNRPVCLLVNPMRMNWKELPEFVEFCSKRGFALGFNTVWRPKSLALWTLPSAELHRIIADLKAVKFSREALQGRFFELNHQIFTRFVDGQLTTWAREQEEREARSTDFASQQAGKPGSRERFQLRFDKAATALALSSERVTELHGKLRELQGRVERNFNEDDFYASLLKPPINDVIGQLQNRSLEDATEWLYYEGEYY